MRGRWPGGIEHGFHGAVIYAARRTPRAIAAFTVEAIRRRARRAVFG